MDIRRILETFDNVYPFKLVDHKFDDLFGDEEDEVEDDVIYYRYEFKTDDGSVIRLDCKEDGNGEWDIDFIRKGSLRLRASAPPQKLLVKGMPSEYMLQC